MSAIDRKLESTKETSPEHLVHQGLNLLDDPALDVDFETRMELVTPLLHAKHLVLGLKHAPEADGADDHPKEGE